MAGLVEDRRISGRSLGFGARGEEAAEGHVVGACSGGLLCQGQVAMTGNANDLAWAQQAPGAGDAAVALADVDAVGINVCGQGGIIVDQKEGAMLPAQGLQVGGPLAPLRRGGGLVPVLQQPGATAQGRLCGWQ